VIQRNWQGGVDRGKYGGQTISDSNNINVTMWL
jgi:hypothetical protein